MSETKEKKSPYKSKKSPAGVVERPHQGFLLRYKDGRPLEATAEYYVLRIDSHDFTPSGRRHTVAARKALATYALNIMAAKNDEEAANPENIKDTRLAWDILQWVDSWVRRDVHNGDMWMTGLVDNAKRIVAKVKEKLV